MKRVRKMTLGVAFVGAACACSGRAHDENKALGGAAAARVDDQPIDLGIVASVAAAQHVSARDAAKKIIDDEIAAAAARRRSLDKRQSVIWRIESTRARWMTDRFLEEAKRRGPPTDEEVNMLSERHWAQVDRPPTVHVAHAIVMLPKDKTLLPQAKNLARDLRSALVDTSNTDFETRAKAAPVAPKLEVKVENLPAFTADGWVVDSESGMDPTFTKAAFALPAPGATSDVIETPFGFHVIRLIERIPEMRMPFESRRIAFIEEVQRVRARTSLMERLKALKAANEVAVSPAAEQLMREVKVEGPAQ